MPHAPELAAAHLSRAIAHASTAALMLRRGSEARSQLEAILERLRAIQRGQFEPE